MKKIILVSVLVSFVGLLSGCAEYRKDRAEAIKDRSFLSYDVDIDVSKNSKGSLLATVSFKEYDQTYNNHFGHLKMQILNIEFQ